MTARDLWERNGLGSKLLWLALLPLSLVYGLGTEIRNLLFRWGCLRSIALPRPVVSVGNLTVGGTGKTPTCLWLAQELRNRGLRVGILSRGYRRHERKPVLLQASDKNLPAAKENSDALAAGDEPLMMARLYGQTVGVGKNRVEAASQLLRSVDVDVFIMDDGFQHRRVKRDVDLLLLGENASGWVLPAGPFREPRQNLRRADFF